jgi:hypothetical protein
MTYYLMLLLLLLFGSQHDKDWSANPLPAAETAAKANNQTVYFIGCDEAQNVCTWSVEGEEVNISSASNVNMTEKTE